jgi:hypothetical protein
MGVYGYIRLITREEKREEILVMIIGISSIIMSGIKNLRE